MDININEILNKTIKKATEGDRDYFITLENKNDPKYWAQITYNSVNVYYPFSEDPLDILKEYQLPDYPGMEIISWEKQKYLTLVT